MKISGTDDTLPPVEDSTDTQTRADGLKSYGNHSMDVTCLEHFLKDLEPVSKFKPSIGIYSDTLSWRFRSRPTANVGIKFKVSRCLK